MHDLCGQTMFFHKGSWRSWEIPEAIIKAYDDRKKIKALKGEDFSTTHLDIPINQWLEEVRKKTKETLGESANICAEGN